MAEESWDWGYRCIQGALSNLGHEIARSTIAAILERHGIEPAPERGRKTTWKEFLTPHWELIVAADFFTIEVWTRYGLQRFMVLFFIELSDAHCIRSSCRQMVTWSALALTLAQRGPAPDFSALAHAEDPSLRRTGTCDATLFQQRQLAGSGVVFPWCAAEYWWPC